MVDRTPNHSLYNKKCIPPNSRSPPFGAFTRIYLFLVSASRNSIRVICRRLNTNITPPCECRAVQNSSVPSGSPIGVANACSWLGTAKLHEREPSGWGEHSGLNPYGMTDHHERIEPHFIWRQLERRCCSIAGERMTVEAQLPRRRVSVTH